MADKKISELNALAAGDVASDDLFVVVDVGSSETKKITTANLASALNFTVGNGNVVGPASATNNSVAIFDGTSGELLKSPGSALTFDGANFVLGTTGAIRTSGANGYFETQLSYYLNAGGGGGFQLKGLGSGVSGIAFMDAGAGVEYARLTSTGLGIGTSSPGGALEIYRAGSGAQVNIFGAGVASPAVFGVDNGGTIAVGASAGDTIIRNAGGTSTLRFSDNAGNIKATLDASGRLLVGGTSNSSGGPVQAWINGTGTGFQTNSAVYSALSTVAGREIPMVYASDGTNMGLISSLSGNMAFFTQGTERARIDSAGNFIHQVNSTAPTLSTNGTMSFELTSNTSLKVVVRGSDGVTRSATLTLS